MPSWTWGFDYPRPLCFEPEPSGDGARLQNGSVRFDFGRALHAFVAQWKCRLFLPARSGVRISPKALLLLVPVAPGLGFRSRFSRFNSWRGDCISSLRRGGTTLESTKLVVLVQLRAEGLHRGYLAAQGTISYVVARQFDPATRDSLGCRPTVGHTALTRSIRVRFSAPQPIHAHVA